ncbi:MAG: hypothetical protein EBR82_62915 [Caulobacteraceae bacterium]|nr:hypothetical protein [Caulobacteraceae bacterium]
MTVAELIEQLKSYPADMRVLTLGYEGGYNDIRLNTDEVVFNFSKNDAWYYGPHECVKFTDSDTGTKCVIITRVK